MRFHKEVIVRCTAAAACLGVFAGFARAPPKLDEGVRIEVVPNSAVIRVLARSQLDFVADLFWVRLGNMSARVSNAREGAALLPLANLIADLAPQFQFPYFVAGVIAPWKRGRTKEYDNAVEAEALMTRGVANVKWVRLYLQKAYTELEMLHDPVAAGNTLSEMARHPGAPSYAAQLATRLLTSGGNFEGARELARSMARSDDPQVQADGASRLKQIDLEEVLVQVDEAVELFSSRNGRPPTTLPQLVEAGLLSEVPADPLGGEILLTPQGARSSTNAERFRPFVPVGDD